MTLEHYQWLTVMVVALAIALPVIFAGWWIFERGSAKNEKDTKRKPKHTMATIKG